jgi:hypothetical protein
MQLSLYRYILFLSDFARHKFPEEIDSYADYYYWDIDIADLKQVRHICGRSIISSHRTHNNNSKLKMDHRGA